MHADAVNLEDVWGNRALLHELLPLQGRVERSQRKACGRRLGAYGKENGEGSAHLRQGGSRACPRTRFPRCTWTSCPRTPESSSRCSCGRKTTVGQRKLPALACQEKTKVNRQIPFFRDMSLLTSSHPGRPVASPRGSQGQPPRSPGGAWKVRFWPACSSSPPSKALGVRYLAAVVVYSLSRTFWQQLLPCHAQRKNHARENRWKSRVFRLRFERGPREVGVSLGSSVHWEKEKVESFSRGTLSGWGKREREREVEFERHKRR